MPKKVNTKKTAKGKLTHNPVTKAAGDIFAKIQTKTGINNKKVDEWQKKWLAIPENRTKYEHLKDVPVVMGEELFAMFNDIIDFVQREEGGKSNVFKRLKKEGSSFLHHPLDFLKQKYQTGKAVVEKGTAKAKGAVGQAKKMAGKVKSATKKATK